MRITYVPQVGNVPVDLPGTIAARDATGDFVYNAICNALNDIIVEPFKDFMGGLWVKFVDVSFVVCLSCVIVGLICGGLGIKKGYKVAAFSIVFYFLLMVVSKAYGWC